MKEAVGQVLEAPWDEGSVDRAVVPLNIPILLHISSLLCFSTSFRDAHLQASSRKTNEDVRISRRVQ